MSIGKYISLEEARKKKKLDLFAKAHPSKGDAKRFNELFMNMALNRPTEQKPPKGGKTLGKA